MSCKYFATSSRIIPRRNLRLPRNDPRTMRNGKYDWARVQCLVLFDWLTITNKDIPYESRRRGAGLPGEICKKDSCCNSVPQIASGAKSGNMRVPSICLHRSLHMEQVQRSVSVGGITHTTFKRFGSRGLPLFCGTLPRYQHVHYASLRYHRPPQRLGCNGCRRQLHERESSHSRIGDYYSLSKWRYRLHSTVDVVALHQRIQWSGEVRHRILYHVFNI